MRSTYKVNKSSLSEGMCVTRRSIGLIVNTGLTLNTSVLVSQTPTYTTLSNTDLTLTVTKSTIVKGNYY